MIHEDKKFEELNEAFLKEKNSIKELISLSKYLEDSKDAEERKMASAHFKKLKEAFKKSLQDFSLILGKINLHSSVGGSAIEKQEVQEPSAKSHKERIKIDKKLLKELKADILEKETLKRMRKEKERERKVFEKRKKKKKNNKYAKMANNLFSRFSNKLLKKESFELLEGDLIKANFQYTPQGYLSVVLFSTFLSIFAGIILFAFFLFFKIQALSPFVTFVEGDLGLRALKLIWLPILIPIGTFLLTFFYASLEKKSAETNINHELPFATIHMAAISGSMIDPSKIFQIMILTKEYPYLEKEFTKLLNEINVYGYDLVSALRNSAFKSPSKKLAELFNGLATTINSGGDLPEFFDKRAETLLFEHRIQKEKSTKAAETFMDIYISIVIAAPMVLMLLLMMMKISGLGLNVSTSTITLIMVLAVSMINIFFIVFLHMKKQPE